MRWALCLAALCGLGWARISESTEASPGGFWSLFDGSRLPFIPVPEIDVDPNSGTTIGIIPVWIRTDPHGDIRRIVAPDVIYNPYFGYGARARWFAYPNDDTLWSVVGGGKQRVEREFDATYESGRLRAGTWSTTFEAVYDRSGTPRFYGFGNNSPVFDETDYTKEQEYVRARWGRNLNAHWQLAYTLRLRAVDVTPGSLAKIASIESRFGRLLGSGNNREILNRLSLGYDTRDSPTIPHHGLALVVYAGLAGRHGLIGSSLYSETGVDLRGYQPVRTGTTIAAHLSLRYLPTTKHTPFWALSSLGGGDSNQLDSSQPLRGYGESRYYDRNAFSANFELRQRIWSFNAVGTHVALELAPFVDCGKVYAHSRTSPLSHLHTVEGVGIRAIASPTVVAYVDVGHGSEGFAIFTGINYPF